MCQSRLIFSFRQYNDEDDDNGDDDDMIVGMVIMIVLMVIHTMECCLVSFRCTMFPMKSYAEKKMKMTPYVKNMKRKR